MVRDQQEVNLSVVSSNFLVQETRRAECQCITETLRVEVRQGFKKLAGMSEIIDIQGVPGGMCQTSGECSLC